VAAAADLAAPVTTAAGAVPPPPLCAAAAKSQVLAPSAVQRFPVQPGAPEHGDDPARGQEPMADPGAVGVGQAPKHGAGGAAQLDGA